MKTFLTLFVLFFSSSVVAEWISIVKSITDEDGITQDLYYDSEIKTEEKHITVWVLMDFHQIVKASGGESQKSTIMLQTIECGSTQYSTEKVKIWRSIAFDRSMGKGNVVADSKSYYEDSPFRIVGPKNNLIVHFAINKICGTL